MRRRASCRTLAIMVAMGPVGCADAGVLQLDTGMAQSSSASSGSTDPFEPDLGSEPPDDTEQGCWPRPEGARFVVRTDGSDVTGDGSESAPWATLAHAVSSVPDQSVIEVGPGQYRGGETLVGSFPVGIVVRAEPPYQAQLRHTGTVVTLAEVQGVTLEGFDIAHEGEGADPWVVHIRDGLGEVGGEDHPTRIVLRDNIIHDSFNNDLLRIDSGVAGVVVEGNVLFNQGRADEHIDINAATDITVCRNIFFNDFEASGRPVQQDTASFVIVKDADGAEDGIVGAAGIEIDSNIFMGWQGDPSMYFLLLAERGNPIYEVRDVVVQNNLMLGDGGGAMRAPLGIKGATEIVIRNNTVVGDIPASAFAFRLNVEGQSPPNNGISFFNNIWSSPAGTIDDLTDTEPSNPLEDFVLDTNLYWNGGLPIPVDDTDRINASSDLNAVLGDPQIEAMPLLNPVWEPEAASFVGGAPTICGAFEALVARHAVPAAEGAAIDAARPDQLPAHDILGRARVRSDLGAVERP